jgi:hypothetical protein
MADKKGSKPQLDGLVQRKGAARPQAPADQQRAAPQQAEKAPPKTKALTLKLTDDDYRRLRRFAFETERSHQHIIETALLEYLDREGG